MYNLQTQCHIVSPMQTPPLIVLSLKSLFTFEFLAKEYKANGLGLNVTA